jgi:sugar phosphate isomerase/epimerase
LLPPTAADRGIMRPRPELIGCYWTLAGHYKFGPHDESPFGFRDRVEAAAEAGYSGIGLKTADLRRILARHPFPEIATLLADHGLTQIELEVVMGWFEKGPSRRESDAERLFLFEAAAALGARHVKCCGSFTPTDASLAQMQDAFAILAAQAAQAGTRMALEPIVFSNIPSLAAAQAIIGPDCPGGGLMLDIWHVNRGAATLEEIRNLPAGAITCAELDDGTLTEVGDAISDTLNRRRLCGEGAFDIPGFIAAVRATGYVGPFGVEIISDSHRERSLHEAATLSYNTAAAQFPR